MIEGVRLAFPSEEVAFYGEESNLRQVRNRVNTMGLTGCVSFLGKVVHEQMPRIYKAHDVLVFPSTRPEGLPLTMIEAMLGGCAVLTTGSGGAMEVATLAGLPLFPKDDSQALSRPLTHLMTNRAEISRIALRGQEVAIQEFSFERMMERFSATLHRLHDAKPEPTVSDSGQNGARGSKQDGHLAVTAGGRALVP